MQKKKKQQQNNKNKEKSCEAITVSLLVHLLMRTQTVTYERELQYTCHDSCHAVLDKKNAVWTLLPKLK